MKKIRWISVSCVTILCIVLLNFIWHNKEYYGALLSKFPFLYNVVESYAIDNFEYPKSVEDLLKYWDAYKNASDYTLTSNDKIVLQYITFDRLKRGEKNIKFIYSDTLFLITYKSDTISWHNKANIDPCDILSKYAPIDQRNMRTFFHVSMQRENSHGFSITTEEQGFKFNKGLYDLVSEKQPEFIQNRRDRKEFKVIVLEFDKGILRPKCQTSGFNLVQYSLYNDLLKYCNDFAVQNDLARIIFYYMYD